MKECAVCGEQITDHAIKCSNGHSVFKKPENRFSNSIQAKLIEAMLRKSTYKYSDSEIEYLTEEIYEICIESRQTINESLIRRIENNLQRKKNKVRKPDRVQLIRNNPPPDFTMPSFQAGIGKQNIERLFPVFRGGIPKDVRLEDRVVVMSDAVNTNVYNRVTYHFDDTTINGPKEFSENSVFWKDILESRLIHGDLVKLVDFNVIEWIPSSPGKYFTNRAIESREQALRYVSDNYREYLPLGKGNMILGGVGSIRLATRFVQNGEIYILCATANGISHQGIPLILNENQYDRLSRYISRSGGGIADISGRIKVFPVEDSPIKFDRQIPKYSIFVDDITVKAPSDNLLVTVAVSYSDQRVSFEEDISHSYRIRGRRKFWTFCSFNPNEQKVTFAVDWMMNYIDRYSNDSETAIVSDFDEHFEHFDYFHEFSIKDIMLGQINSNLVRQYEKNSPIMFNTGDIIMAENHTYNIGQAGAVGPNAQAHNVTFNQGQVDSWGEIDISQLAQELKFLKESLRQEAEQQIHFTEISTIAEAEEKAGQGERAKTLETLAKVSKWSLDTATSIGVRVAAEAIKIALGL